MSLVSIVNNNNMVYVTLELAVAFQFASSSEMSQLIQYEINSTVRPSSVACRQREREAKRFDCLMNYPGGVPRSPYDASFWYQRDGY
jgi:hypothetical protein